MKGIIMKDVTPKAFACSPFPACPRIYRTSRGTYIIIGRRLDPAELSDVSLHLSDEEAIVEIPAELIDELENK
jgi:hypothetical protein